MSEEEDQGENKNNIERLADDIFIILKEEPYLDQMNALLTVISHNLFEAHSTKERQLEALNKIIESIVGNLIYIEDHGQFINSEK